MILADTIRAQANRPIITPHTTALYPGLYWGGYARELIAKSRILESAECFRQHTALYLKSA